MSTGMGMVRRVVAGLLALALLVLPAAPLRHASAAPLGHQTAAHCVAHGDGAPAGQAATAAHQADHQGQPYDQTDGKPGLARCVSAQCPAMVAAPPLAGADLLPSPGPMIRLALRVGRPPGIDVAPALPPPREAA